jgi:hypothetical protein
MSRQPTAPPERTFSFVSPVPSEQEEVAAPPDEQSAATDTIAIDEAEDQRSVSSTSSSTISSASDAVLEEFEEPPPLSRTTTRQPTHRLSGFDVDSDRDTQPPVLRMTRSKTQPSRRQSIRSPSPIPEETQDEPTISRTATRQPTLTSIDPTAELTPPISPDSELNEVPRETTPEPVPRKATMRRYTQRDPSPETPMRRTTTRYSVQEPLPSQPVTRRSTRSATEERDSEEPGESILTRAATERLPSPEEIVRRVTTRRRTEPIDEPLAPPSSPSTGEEPVPEDTEQENERVPRVLTVSRSQTTRPRSVSIAPGIEVAPPQPATKDDRPTEPRKRRHKKVTNYPPEEQHPAAPTYPSRETPRWTRPDTQTPPPRPKADPEPKKRRFLGWGTKPKEQPQPIERSDPEPFRDRHFVPPFRHAAPGPRGPPGGTLQRPTGYIDPPRQEPYRPVYTPPTLTTPRILSTPGLRLSCQSSAHLCSKRRLLSSARTGRLRA